MWKCKDYPKILILKIPTAEMRISKRFKDHVLLPGIVLRSNVETYNAKGNAIC